VLIPLTMKQGDTWTVQVVWYPPITGTEQPDLTEDPIDMTGFTAKLQVRRRPGEPGAPALALTSSPAAGLTIDAPNGTITARATPAQTDVIPAGPWHWEVEVTNGVDTYTLAEGPLTVRGQTVI
jgi:hypothetical protein